ncbi:unnamed protein product [Urochloa decumbens]|uniref:Cupin type-1 domain-containing protein n=1 Tax=Urochloa decumbens TaxID=240449 RepID=A0ABC8WJE6_9POAL
MAPTTCLCIGFLLLLGHGSMAELQAERGLGLEPVAPSSSCEFTFDKLQPLEPLPKLKAEAGTVEHFNDTNHQLKCAGVFLIRVVVDNRGLLLPSFTNGGALIFAIKGSGFVGVTFPGCPETPYSHLKEGYVATVPAGDSVWIYNDGGKPLEMLVLFTTSGKANKLWPKNRDFILAGSSENGRKNIFNGFTVDFLSESLGISHFLTTKLQGPTDKRGPIVRVPAGLTPEQQPWLPASNSVCGTKVTASLEDPKPQGTTLLTAYDFPALKLVGLSIERGALKPNASHASPIYNSNAQIVLYVTGGSFRRLQVVDNRGVAVFDGVLRQGQPLVIPQYYVALAQAGKDGAQYVVFKTDAYPVTHYIAGWGSVLRSFPVGVIAAAYNVSTTDALKIKNSGGWGTPEK